MQSSFLRDRDERALGPARHELSDEAIFLELGFVAK
jgi:hypothetical protein